MDTTSRRASAIKAAAAAGAAISLLLAGCSNSSDDAGESSTGRVATATLELAHVGAPDSPQQTIAEMFATALDEESDGAMTVEFFDSGTIGNEQELQGAIVDGSLDIAIAGTFSHYAPWAGILETPVLFRDLDHFNEFAQGSIGQELMEVMADEVGIAPLFIAPHEGFRYITTASTPIREPDDMAGLNLRNPEVAAYNVMAEAVGASPTPLAFDELYLALERGVVDGQHNPLGHVLGQSFYNVQDYLSMVPWGITPHIVSMSAGTWDGLDEEQQQVVTVAAERTAAAYPTVAVQNEDEALEFLEGLITIVRPEEVDVDAFVRVFEDDGLPRLEGAYGDDGMYWVNQITNL
jgi:C4-dicarboxylate-binding protein DctP